MCLVPALSGCELSRPEGAYTPFVPEAGAPIVEFEDGSVGNGPPINIPGMGGDDDGGGGGTTIPEPDNESYKGLVGSFAMRLDEDTFSSSKTGGLVSVDLSMDNRVSRFLLAQIEERDGRLVSSEWLCHQTHVHVCKSSQCKSATTTIFPSAARLLPTAVPITRDLTLSPDGTLAAPLASTYLGFDASADKALPTSTKDERMWDPIPDVSGREGLYTDLSMTVQVNNILGAESVRCQLSVVQRLELGWSVSVKNGDVLELGSQPGTFEVGPATSGAILAAVAQPTNKTEDCKGNGTSQDSTTKRAAVAQFHALGAKRVKACPTLHEFDNMLPAAPLP